MEHTEAPVRPTLRTTVGSAVAITPPVTRAERAS
jgi:hypothetical protein